MNRWPSFRSRPRAFRQAFTLLEVILAIGLLTLGLAAIMRINQMSYGNIRAASDGLHAEMVAETVVSELLCGLQPIENLGPVTLDPQLALGDWQVQVIVEETVAVELLQVRVLVGKVLDGRTRPECEVVRWFPNPEFQPVPPAAPAAL